MCDITEDTRLEVAIESPAGTALASAEIMMMVYPSPGISALVRDLGWIQVTTRFSINFHCDSFVYTFQTNICPIVGVAGGVVFLIIISAQAAIICRHKRHGCQSFSSGKVNMNIDLPS